MKDKEFWKKKYKDVWEEGNYREGLVKSFLESLGFQVNIFGFETLSKEYNPNFPREKGKPNFYIVKDGIKIFFEVTGTSVKTVSANSKIWIRPDKIKYVKKYGYQGYCVHILTHLDLMRFIPMENINDQNIIEPNIRGSIETFYEVSPDMCLSKEEFIQIIRDPNGSNEKN